MTRDMAWDFPLGLVAPANFALHVARYLYESPATREHMAMVAVKNHHHGVSNPKAQLRFEITVDQVLNAPMVVEPFGLYDCTPQSDGAAAVLLVAEDVVDRYTDRPVWVRGVGLGLDRVMHAHKPDMTTFPPTVKAAKQAYAMAGVGPADIDVAEVHDCFSGVELINYEDLGFCDRFEAYKLIEAGETAVGGRIPVNPSGGLKAKGHPPGATGIAQCYELFAELRGRPTSRWTGPVGPWPTTWAGRRRCRPSPSSAPNGPELHPAMGVLEAGGASSPAVAGAGPGPLPGAGPAGATVVVNDLGVSLEGQVEAHEQAPADQVVAEIETLGAVAVADHTSVTDWDGMADLVARTVERFGGLTPWSTMPGSSGTACSSR